MNLAHITANIVFSVPSQSFHLNLQSNGPRSEFEPNLERGTKFPAQNHQKLAEALGRRENATWILAAERGEGTKSIDPGSRSIPSGLRAQP